MIVTNKGLGVTGSQIVGAAGSAVMSAGAAVAMLAPASGPLAPIIAAVGGLIALAGVLGVGNGCGPTCVQATSIVNQAEPAFEENLSEYESGQISQSQAISNYNAGQTAIAQACGAIPGSAGQNCVSDRFTPGGCKWNATSQPYPSSPAVGECWNWYSGYYLPLTQPAQTPYQGETISGSTVVSDLTSSPLVLVAAAVAAGLVITHL